MIYTVTMKVEYQITHRVDAESLEDAVAAAKKRSTGNAKAVNYTKKQFSDFRVMEMTNED